jgi:hypothetical protein
MKYQIAIHFCFIDKYPFVLFTHFRHGILKQGQTIIRQFPMVEDNNDHAFLDVHETLSHLTESF